MDPLQHSYLKSIVLCAGIRSLNVAGRAKRINIYTFVDLPGLMWTVLVRVSVPQAFLDVFRGITVVFPV